MNITINPRKQLIIFTRYPEPGRTKTRMIPALGETGAAELHQQMTEYTVSKLQNLPPSFSLVIYHNGGTAEKMRSWLGSHLSYYCQRGGDLGERMRTAFEEGFARKIAAIAIIGTDCPDLDRGIILEAFEKLLDHDLVLGPAKDGGYYLIGSRRVFPELFRSIPWGTSKVLETTRSISRKLGLSSAYLPELTDVDRPSDLPYWQNRLLDSRLNDDGGSLLH